MGFQYLLAVLCLCLTSTRNSDSAVIVVQKKDAMLEKMVRELWASQYHLA
jgi:hypothetical protein